MLSIDEKLKCAHKGFLGIIMKPPYGSQLICHYHIRPLFKHMFSRALGQTSDSIDTFAFEELPCTWSDLGILAIACS
jgi:hypothetical protein